MSDHDAAGDRMITARATRHADDLTNTPQGVGGACRTPARPKTRRVVGERRATPAVMSTWRRGRAQRRWAEGGQQPHPTPRATPRERSPTESQPFGTGGLFQLQVKETERHFQTLRSTFHPPFPFFSKNTNDPLDSKKKERKEKREPRRARAAAAAAGRAAAAAAAQSHSSCTCRLLSTSTLAPVPIGRADL